MKSGRSRSARRASPQRQPYHHGDLRRALVRAAIEILRTGGTEALSLRAAAREAGVSQSAPYRHFPDKRALLAAVAEDGFERLGAAIEDSVGKGPPGVPALRRGLRSYVEFALRHPAEYRVMFGSELASHGAGSEVRTVASSVFGLLRGGIERLQLSGAIAEGDGSVLAITAWSLLHGLVMLSLDGQLAQTGRPTDEVVEAAIGVALSGLTRGRNS